MITRTLVVGAGGFLGASARYVLGGLVYRWLPATFPWATLVINVTGCFGIGFLAVMVEERMVLGPSARLFLMVGILGGYTTFSTFGYETIALLRESSFAAAALNVLGQVALGLVAVAAGAAAARVLP
ncbi:MAG TPA: fluoride efflux transporter CrcB [Vicinamibacteria bacterium]